MKKIYVLIVIYLALLNASAQPWQVVGTTNFGCCLPTYGYQYFKVSKGGVPYVLHSVAGSSFAVMKFASGNWTNVGSIITSSAFPNSALTLDQNGNPAVVYSDYDYLYHTVLKVIKFNGTIWVNVGGPFGNYSWGTGNNLSICYDNVGTPYVAFSDGFSSQKISVMKFNGSFWEIVGSAGFSLGAISGCKVVCDNNIPYVIFVGGNISVMKFNGSSWTYVGSPGFASGNSTSGGFDIAINNSGIPLVVGSQFIGSSSPVWEFNGTSWINIGPVLPYLFFENDGAKSIVITTIGIPYISFDGRDPYYRYVGASVMKYQGGVWAYIGDTIASLTMGSHTTLAVDSLGNPFIAYTDPYNTTVRKYNMVTGIHENNSIQNINIGPNPSKGKICVTITNNVDQTKEIDIFNLLGEKIYSGNLLSGTTRKEISLNVAEGIYFVKVNDEKNVYTYKLIVE